MNQQMKRVQKAFNGENDVVILSFTCYPEVDTVAQMRKHAKFLGAELPQWQLLTGDKDELYQSALDIIRSEGKASTSFLQRKLQIGYNRAARIIEEMEEKGIISAPNSQGKREIIGQDN